MGAEICLWSNFFLGGVRKMGAKFFGVKFFWREEF